MKKLKNFINAENMTQLHACTFCNTENIVVIESEDKFTIDSTYCDLCGSHTTITLEKVCEHCNNMNHYIIFEN